MTRFTIPLATAVILVLGSALGAPRPSAVAQEATPELELERGVAYGEADGQKLLLDIYQPPAGEGSRPAVILVPGWESGRSSMIGPAMALAEAGYVTFAIDYRLHWPEHIDDAQLAVRWVRANADRYGVDPERICSYGESTGGQLAAMMGVRDTRDETEPALAEHSSRVACAVVLSGEHDMTIPYTEDFWNTWLVDMLGGTLDEVPERYRDVSPVAFVDAQSAPFLVIHGGRDTVVPMEHSRRLVAALQAAGVEVVYADLVDEDHASVPEWGVSGPYALAFLDRHLHPERGND
jgi:acetyl esterase/lipase